MTGQFDGRELAIGVARGVRSFDVDEFGRLRGVQYADVWKPGENTARCARTVVVDGWEVEHALSGMYSHEFVYRNVKTGQMTPRPPRVPEKPEGHSLADCSHGFYAYYDGSDDYRSDARISAVVEGYGDVLIGTRGFRAGKARIVALCIPSAASTKGLPAEEAPVEKLRWRDRAWFALAVKSCAVGGGMGWAANGVTQLVAGIPLWFGIPWTGIGVAAAIGAWLVPVKFQPRKPKGSTYDAARRIALGRLYTDGSAAPAVPAVTVEKIRHNYPDVPVFGRFEDMVREFPPDRGLEPSPETDPKFWEAAQ